jgi:hypothetical protein
MNDNLLQRYKKSLEGLTVGGSEYWNEPERCARDIKHKLEYQDERIKEFIMERKKIYTLPIVGWLVKKLA